MSGEMKRRKIERTAETNFAPKYEILRDGVVVGIAVMTGSSGRDDYPWDWYLADGLVGHRGSAGAADTLRSAIEYIDWNTR